MLAVAGLGAGALLAGYILAVGLAVAVLAFADLLPRLRRPWVVGGVLVAVAGGIYLTGPCRMPTFWPMEVAGHFCGEFPIRARSLAAGTGKLPGSLPGRTAWIRSQAHWEAVARELGLAPPPAVDWDREWVLLVTDPGAADPPRLLGIHQDWDQNGTVVVTVARPPGEPGAAAGGWRALAVDRTSFWKEPAGPRALLRGGPGVYYRDPPLPSEPAR